MSNTTPTTYKPLGWIAAKIATDPHAIEQFIAEVDAKGLNRDIADPFFRAWMTLVDRRCIRRVGLGASDLEDWCSWDTYESGASPAEGAQVALESSDLYGMFFGD